MDTILENLQDILPNVDMEKSFIENGGDSLAAIKFVQKLRKEGLNISAMEILQAHSLNEFLDLLNYFSPDNKSHLEVVKSILNKYNLIMENGLLEQGGDSLTAIKLRNDLNEQANINISAVDMLNAKKLKDLFDLKKKVSNSYPMIDRLIESRQDNINHFLISNFFLLNYSLTEDKAIEMIEEMTEKFPILKSRFNLKKREFFLPQKEINTSNIVSFIDQSNTEISSSEIYSVINATHKEISIDSNLTKIVFLKSKKQTYAYLCLHHVVGDIISLNLLQDFLCNYGTNKNLVHQKIDLEYFNWKKELSSKPLENDQIEFEKILSHVRNIPIKKTKVKHQKVIILNKEKTQKLERLAQKVDGATLEDIYRCYISFAIMNTYAIDNVVTMTENNGRNLLNTSKYENSIGWYTAIFPERVSVKDDLLNTVIEYVKNKYRGNPHSYGVLKYTKNKFKELVEPNISISYLGNMSALENTVSSNIQSMDLDQSNHLFFDYTFSVLRSKSQVKIIIDYYDDNLNDKLISSLETEIFKSDLNRTYPLTNMQSSMLLQSINDSGKYISQATYKTVGKKIALNRLEKNISQVLKRSKACSTQLIEDVNGKMLQFFPENNEPIVQIVEAADIKELKEKTFKSYLSSNQQICVFLTKAEQEVLICITFNHLILDGISINLLLKDIENSISVVKQGEYVEDPYLDFLRRKSNSKDYEYWKNKVSDFYRRNSKSFFKAQNSFNKKTSSISFTISNSEFYEIDSFLKDNRITPSTLINVCTAWALRVINFQETIAFGRIISGRQKDIEHIDEAIGLLINNLPTKISIDSNNKILDILRSFQNENLEDLSHTDVNLVRIKSDLKLQDNYSDITLSVREQTNKENSLFKFVSGMENNEIPLALSVDYEEGKLLYAINYHPDYLNLEVAQAFKNILKETFLQIVRGAKNFGELKYTKARYNKLSKNKGWDLLKHLKIWKNNKAITFEGQYLTYKELLSISENFAENLINKGVRAGDRVISYQKRGPSYVAMCIALQKIGAILIPIDDTSPLERVKYIFEDSNAKCIICDSEINLNLERIKTSDFDKYSCFSTYHKNNSSDDVYILYTSGTTGKPKGSEITYGSLENLIVENNDIMSINKNDRVLMFASHSFDAHILEMMAALYAGANLVIANEIQRHDMQQLEILMKNENVTFALIPPVLMQYIKFKKLKRLSTIMNAGDFVDVEVLKKIPNNVTYINGYGPSEGTIWTSYFKTIGVARKINSYSEGKAIKNVSINIIDNKTILPNNIIGEVAISGANLSKGYVNRTELNFKKFVSLTEDEFTFRAFKTGDMGYLDKEGNLHLVGRRDDQVKISGMRIELNEVVNALEKIDEVNKAAVLVIDDKASKHLEAFLDVKNNSLTKSMLVRQLLKLIPIYMVPQKFYHIKKFPLTANGKVDKKLLYEKRDTYLELESDLLVDYKNVDQLFIDAIRKVIGKKQTINLDRSFIENGGNSIEAIQLFNILKRNYASINVIDILTNTSLLEAYKNCKVKGNASALKENTAMKLRSYIYQPSIIQEWFNKQIFNNSCSIFEIRDVKLQDLFKAIRSICSSQDVLRSKINKFNGKMKVEVLGTLPDIHFISAEIIAANPEYIKNREKRINDRNLFDGKKYSSEITVYEVGKNVYRVSLLIDHALWDAYSAMLFEQQVKVFLEKHTIERPKKQFCDFISIQRQAETKEEKLLLSPLRERKTYNYLANICIANAHNEFSEVKNLINLCQKIAGIKGLNNEILLLTSNDKRSKEFADTLGLFLDFNVLKRDRSTKKYISIGYVSEYAKSVNDLQAITFNFMFINYISEISLVVPAYNHSRCLDGKYTNESIVAEKRDGYIRVNFFSNENLTKKIENELKEISL